MLKLRKPFLPKVHLHIRQDLIQGLWEKYVPSSSEEYGRISLFYREAEDGQEQQPGQVQVLINLILKNRLVQMGLEGFPPILADRKGGFGEDALKAGGCFPLLVAGKGGMERSLKRMERYYLLQLKSSDPVIFGKLKQYISLLEQSKEEGRRYRQWQKDYHAIERQREEYQIFSLFSVKVKELLFLRSVEMARTLEKKLLASLSKKKYRALTKEPYYPKQRESDKKEAGRKLSIWKRGRKEMRRSIDGLEPEKVQELWVQMDKVYAEQLVQIWEQYRQKFMESFTAEVFSMAKQEEFHVAMEFLEENQTSCLRAEHAEQIIGMLEQERNVRKEQIELLEIRAVERYQGIAKEAELQYLMMQMDQKTERTAILPNQEKQEDMAVLPYQAGQLAEQAFIWQHKEELSEEEVHRASEWGRAFLEFFYASQGQMEQDGIGIKNLKTEELQYLIGQSVRELESCERESETQHWMEDQKRKSETLHWVENHQESAKIQEAAAYIQELQEGKREEYIKNLAELAALWNEEQLGQLVEQTFIRQYKNGLSEEEVHKASKWGRAFLESFYASQGQMEQDGIEIKNLKTEELQHLIGQSVRELESRERENETLDRMERQERESETLHWMENHQESPRIQEAAAYIQGLQEGQREEYIKNLAELAALWREERVRQLVEQAFLKRHKTKVLENIQTASEWDVELPENIQTASEWGREFLKYYEISQEETGSVYSKSEVQHFIRELVHLKGQQAQAGESEKSFLLENSLENPKIQEAVRVIQNMQEMQQEEFISWLAEQALLWHSENPQRLMNQVNEQTDQQMEKSPTGVSYQQLWEWGEALLFSPEHEKEWEDPDILYFSGDEEEADMQTQLIRRQIEAAKDRNSLQQLIMQINHKAHSTQQEKEQKSAVVNGEGQKFQLVYADSELKSPAVQSLLGHIRELDEAAYGTLVKELSETANMQWVLYSGQEAEEAVSAALRKLMARGGRELLQPIRRQKEERYEFLVKKLSEILPDKKESGTLPKERAEEADSGNVRGMTPIKHRMDRRYMAALYPKLAHRIQEYETQRYEELQEKIRRLGQEYFNPGFSELKRPYLNDGLRGIKTKAAVPGQTGLWNKEENPRQEGILGSYQAQGLEYSVQRFHASEEEQHRKEMRIQEETEQMKSVQEQLGKKLQEVETQLKQVENASKAREDVRVFADQVKKQLYEELHVEKLRRGLI